MMDSLVFTSPWILGFLAVLPVLWWLLRLTPPSPRKVVFPALTLLRGLATAEQTPARTPWWLLLLRIFILTLAILALAGPVADPAPALPGAGSVLIAVDNDWAAARGWDLRQEALRRIIRQAEHENRDIIFLPTAPPAGGEAMRLLGPMAAKAAHGFAATLVPEPWSADWTAAKALLDKLDDEKIAYGYWLAGGLGGKGADAFLSALRPRGTLRDFRVLADPETPIYTLQPPAGDGDDSFTVMRTATENAGKASVLALGSHGRVLARVPVEFTAGAPRAVTKLDVPLEVHNEVTRLEVEGQRTAGATALLDENWQHRPVGLIGDKSEEIQNSLLSGIFYIDRALKPFADIHMDALDKLLSQNMAVIIANDNVLLSEGDMTRLAEWIRKGGVFVRFAGDRLASGYNPQEAELLPVSLRTGGRAMGGGMSWSTPQKLQEFPASSPFRGLEIPSDVAISRQLLAEPEAELARKSWAMLGDGTPLVTAKNIDSGITVLFHVPARSEWSSLPLSGLFVDMLRRIVDLGHIGANGTADFSSLAPKQVLDGFGDLQQPGLAVKPLENADTINKAVGPQHPPGYYGNDGYNKAFNLGASVGQPQALGGAAPESYRMKRGEIDLQPPLLAAVFILLCVDFLLSLLLRGLFSLGRPVRNAGIAVLLVLAMTGPVMAADKDKAPVELTARTYLGYIRTGNVTIDRVSEAGLKSLARILQRRTSLNDIGVAGVNPDSDELAFFPLLYWPLSTASVPLEPAGAARINNYLRHGGMIVFDSGFEGSPLPAAVMERVLAGIAMPPLIPIPENHVLRRSFYLLDEFPGRHAGPDLWLEPEDTASFDGVATVIAGSGGWAGAWATDENGNPLFPCTPGGERQREYAFRFGVNLVMYALTGNYKSDQLHAQALLERLGK